MYWALEINEKTQDRILTILRNFVDFDKMNAENWLLYCDHITLIHSKSVKADVWEAVNKILKNFEGCLVNFQITHLAEGNYALALGVSVSTMNTHSHITIACAPGHRPVESNELEKWTPVICMETFSGILKLKD